MTNCTIDYVANPFYASTIAKRDNPLMAALPVAPKNGSPVPHLTSLYHHQDLGHYGNRSYPGNCGGNIIRDLLNFFQPKSVFDPMTGSGTCRDVCNELGIQCESTDLKHGFDACNPDGYRPEWKFDFIWAHPPYWRQKVYSESPNDLSQAKSIDEFLQGYGQFIRNCTSVLNDGGKFAVLMGDYNDRENGFVPLTYFTKQLAFDAGLVQCCTDIVRFSFGATSSRKVYSSSFIPGLHDMCMVFEKPKSNNGGRDVR